MAKNKKKYFAVLILIGIFFAGIFAGAILIKNDFNMKFVFEYIFIPIITLCASSGVILLKCDKASFAKTFFYGILTEILVMPALLCINNFMILGNLDFKRILNDINENKLITAAFILILIAISVVLYYLLSYIKGKSRTKSRRYN